MGLQPGDPLDGVRSRMDTAEDRLRVLEAWFRKFGPLEELQRDVAVLEDRVGTLEMLEKDRQLREGRRA